jgi:hypothetical protein
MRENSRPYPSSSTKSKSQKLTLSLENSTIVGSNVPPSPLYQQIPDHNTTTSSSYPYPSPSIHKPYTSNPTLALSRANLTPHTIHTTILASLAYRKSVHPHISPPPHFPPARNPIPTLLDPHPTIPALRETHALTYTA